MHPRKTSIHRGLVGERKLVGSAYLAKSDLRAEYETEIAPRTEEAIRRILSQVVFAPGWPKRVLDLGAGTGAVGRALRACIDTEFELVAVDKVPGPGILAADVLRGVRPAGVSGRFDLIVSAHLLNELSEPLDLDGQARLVAGWCRDLLEPDGMCILVEPALRKTSRAFLGVRDRLLAAGLHVAAPCFFQGACPALQSAKDWCHDSSKVLVVGRSRVDFSYLVLLRSPAEPADPSHYRVATTAWSATPSRTRGAFGILFVASRAATCSCVSIGIANLRIRPWTRCVAVMWWSCRPSPCVTGAFASAPIPSCGLIQQRLPAGGLIIL
jgi:ribosomal protein RSM22 (predicted rRNA methylase)